MAELNLELHTHHEAAIHVVHDVFVTMLGSDAWPVDDDGGPCENPIIGTIHLAGGWEGLVLTGFEPSLAFAVTAHMLKIEEPRAVGDAVRDAVGEVANIVAGNLKALLPEHAAMSIPQVVEGTSARKMEVPGMDISRLYFDTTRGRFWLTLVPLAQSPMGEARPAVS